MVVLLSLQSIATTMLIAFTPKVSVAAMDLLYTSPRSLQTRATNASNLTLLELVEGDPDLSTLRTALGAAGLAEALDNKTMAPPHGLGAHRFSLR